MSEVKISIAAGTNVGLFRQNNEDSFVVCSDLNTSEWLNPQVGQQTDLGELGALLVVADGMGGANAGEVASAIAVNTVQEQFVPENLRSVIEDDKTVQEYMKAVVKQADLNIFNQSKENPETQGMGTTIVMVWILNDKAYICWCGDSRCYVLSKRKGLVQLSKDHSYVQELVDKGELNPELMHEHPLSNVITRCLGDAENRAEPETRVYQLYNGDVLMLCSDGLCGLCHDDVIKDTMVQYHDTPEECKDELISLALSCGGYDNVTVALANVYKENEFVGDEETDEENTDNNDSEEKEDNGENLSSTIRNEVVGHHSHKIRNFILMLLLLVIAAGIYLYVARETELVKDLIMDVTPYWEKLIRYINL